MVKNLTKVLVIQSCLTFCDPMDCSPPGSFAHGILQPRILEWVSYSLLQGIFPTKESTSSHLFCISQYPIKRQKGHDNLSKFISSPRGLVTLGKRETPGKGEPGGLPSMGSHRVGHY